MPNITINSNEIDAAYVGEHRIIKIYTGSVLIYQAVLEPKTFIDADGKNFIDADGNQFLVY